MCACGRMERRWNSPVTARASARPGVARPRCNRSGSQWRLRARGAGRAVCGGADRTSAQRLAHGAWCAQAHGCAADRTPQGGYPADRPGHGRSSRRRRTHGPRNRLLRSVPGVGPVFAHTLLALMPELGHLPRRRPRHCSAWLPSTAKAEHSGDNDAPSAAANACAMPPTWQPLSPDSTILSSKPSGSVAETGQPPKVILIAIMRKLICALNAMINTINHGPPDKTAAPIVVQIV